MKFFLIAIAVILGFLVMLLFAPLKINVEYRDQKIKLTFRCVFIKFTISDSSLRRIGKRKNSQETKPRVEDKKSVIARFNKFRDGFDGAKVILAEIIKFTKRRAKFSDIYLRVRYGTGEAAITGMLYGGIWGLIGNVYAYLCRHFYVEFPKVELEPVYNQVVFDIELQGIIRTRLVHIILCAFKLLGKKDND